MFARDFRQERAAREAAGLFWQLSIEEDHVSTSKEDRIAALEAPTSNGWLQFADDLPLTLFQQFDDFPDGDHDDGPDATASAWRLSGGVRKQLLATRPIC